MTIDKLVERSDLFTYGIVKPSLTLINHLTCNSHCEMPDSTYNLLAGGTPVLYAGLHKSLWETVGVLYLLSKKYNLPIPYPVMAYALISGKIPHWFMKHIGVDSTMRNGGRENITLTIERIQSRIYDGNSVLIFPGMEKGRQKSVTVKPFETTAFDALIQMESSQYIVPFNVDYTRVNELRNLKEINEFLDRNNHYVFKFKHISRWLFRNFGDIYVTFGEPIEVTSDMNRRELADYTRLKCLDLVKILAPNITSKAMLRINIDSEGRFSRLELYAQIEDVRQELLPYSDKFRGFNMNTSPKEIIEQSMLPLDVKWMEAYKMYAGYISHYPEK